MDPCHLPELPLSRGGDPGQRELDLESRWLFEEEDPHLPLPGRLGVEVRVQMVVGEKPAPAPSMRKQSS